MVPQHALTVTYENWNFGNEFKATYTRHKTSIWGDPNGTAWCWWDWERWGEGASLLKVAVLHSHS